VRPVWDPIWQIINSSPKAPPSPLVTVDPIEKDLHLYQAPQYVGQFDNKYYTKQFLYAVKANGDLIWYAHVIGIDRNPPKEPSVKEKAPTSAEQVMKPSTTVAAMATKKLGGVTQGASSTTQGAKSSVTSKVVEATQPPAPRIFHQWEGPKQVGNGWQSFAAVIPAGMSGIYGVAKDGSFNWYRHDGFLDGAVKWKGPVNVSSGWISFQKIMSGGDGVLYGIGADGSLLWHRHQDYLDASTQPKWSGPVVVGSGWQNFVHVFSTGEGVIYAVKPTGELLWYRHRGYLNGQNAWDGP
jgi:Tachylectin